MPAELCCSVTAEQEGGEFPGPGGLMLSPSLLYGCDGDKEGGVEAASGAGTGEAGAVPTCFCTP